MNKTELIETIVANTGVKKSDVQKVFDGMLAPIAETMRTGDTVTLRRFGTFAQTSAEREGELVEEVAFRVSPHFTARCQADTHDDETRALTTRAPTTTAPKAPEPEAIEPEAPEAEATEVAATEAEMIVLETREPEEREPTADALEDKISTLRSLLGNAPSEWAWRELALFFTQWPTDDPERELALSYAKNHFAADTEWAPYLSRENHIEGLSLAYNEPTPGEGMSPLVEGIVKRHRSITKALEIMRHIEKLKVMSLPGFLKSMAKVADISQLAMTGEELHPKGWLPAHLAAIAPHAEELRAIQTKRKLSKQGILLAFVHNRADHEEYRTLKEGHNDQEFYTIDAEFLMVDQETRNHLTCKAEGAYTCEMTYWEGVAELHITTPPRLLVNGEVLFDDFGPFDEDDEDDNNEASFTKAALQLHNLLAATFPGKAWEALKPDATKAPKSTEKFLQDILDWCELEELPAIEEEW